MENTIVRLDGTDDSNLEFNVVKTNFIPYREKRELGIDVMSEGKRFHFYFEDESRIDELICYLEGVKKYCSDFNLNSKCEID